MKPSLRIAPKFLLVVAVLVPSMLASAWLGVHGLAAMRAKINGVTLDNLRISQQSGELARAISATGELALEAVDVQSLAVQDRLDAQLVDVSEPTVDTAISRARQLDDSDPVERAALAQLTSQWRMFLALEHTGVLDYTGRNATRVNETAAVRIAGMFSVMQTASSHVAAKEVHDASLARANALATADRYRTLMILISVGTLLVVLAVVAWLIRGVVPRITAYAAFARRVADRDLAGRVALSGSDELSQLGLALNQMVQQAESDRAVESRQREFVSAMQLTESEDEARELLRRHICRVVPDSSPFVLVRNNSEDRLQATSSAERDDPQLAARLVDAKPRSCLAVRFAQSQKQGGELDPLLECDVCGKRPGYSLCEPLIVHGEVIGSVLLTRPEPTDEVMENRLRESIAQASPVLGNLRNLAIAERRAATDALTGLPNNRAAQDNVRRMVAQASRSASPLSAGLVDLDHFKQLNDVHGHPKADEVLALVGATLAASARESDFVARYGGEEFLILMPDTDLEGGLIVAEKLRAAIAGLVLPDLERPVTASIGVAAYPLHASDASTLIRHADRALYLAKQDGRNRVAEFVAGVGAVLAV